MIGNTMTNRQRAFWTIPALVAGFCLRAWFVLMHPRIGGDGSVYGDIARNWLQTGIYGLTGPTGVRPTLMRLPGYPLFLAICFKIFDAHGYAAALWVQCFVDLATCLLVSGIAREIAWEDSKAALIALWIAALCPFTANFAAAALTETLSLFCVALAFYSLIRWRRRLRHAGPVTGDDRQRSSSSNAMNLWIWVIAFAMAYAILLRPDGGLLPAAVVPAMIWVVWRHGLGPIRGFGAVALCSVITLLPLIPWTARNARTFHQFQPLAPKYTAEPGEVSGDGFHRWYRTWAIDYASTVSIYWKYDMESMDIGELPRHAFDSGEQYQKTDKLFSDYNELGETTQAIDDRFAELASERVAANRVGYYLLLPSARVANMWLRPRTELLDIPAQWWRYNEHPVATLFAAFYAALNLAYLAAALLGFVRALQQRNSLPVLWAAAGFIALRCLLLATVDNSEPRYVLECFPLVIALGAVFLAGNQPKSLLSINSAESSSSPRTTPFGS